MKRTISLGIELAEYANEITDVFTTKDYVKALQEEYKDHVLNFYSPDENNLFTIIYKFQTILQDTAHRLTPCKTPLVDMPEVLDELKYIAKNIKAYRQVIYAVKQSCRKNDRLGNLVINFLDSLSKGIVELRTSALYYDQHAGNVLTAAYIIKTVHAYGKLTGLVDYYNFKEKLDGGEVEH